MRDPEMTPAEREVWQTVQRMNQAWTSGRVDDLEEFFHPDMVAVTPTEPRRLEGRAACIASWRQFTERAVIHAWRELEPRVQIFGEAAVVSYGYELQCELRGRQVLLAGRDLMTLT